MNNPMLDVFKNMSLTSQMSCFVHRKASREDLEDRAEWLLSELPDRMKFANRMIATPDQTSEFYHRWKQSLKKYINAERVCGE